MKFLRKCLKCFVDVLTMLLLLVLVLVLYGKIIVTFDISKYPNYFGYTFFEVASGSMEPTLYVDDVILVKIDKSNINVNDIIAYSSNDSIITHRIIFINDNLYTVKGDNNNVADSPITNDQIIGKVIKVFPKLSTWKKIVSEPKILITLFITMLLFDFALSYDKNGKSKDKKSNNYPFSIDELQDFTRKIDIEEVNNLLENNVKLSNKEISNLKDEILNIEDEKPKLSKNEVDFLEYTMRLDIAKIRDDIKNKVK